MTHCEVFRFHSFGLSIVFNFADDDGRVVTVELEEIFGVVVEHAIVKGHEFSRHLRACQTVVWLGKREGFESGYLLGVLR